MTQLLGNDRFLQEIAYPMLEICVSSFSRQEVQLTLLKCRAYHLQEVSYFQQTRKSTKPTATTAVGVWPPTVVTLSKQRVTQIRTRVGLSDVDLSRFPKNHGYYL